MRPVRPPARPSVCRQRRQHAIFCPFVRPPEGTEGWTDTSFLDDLRSAIEIDRAVNDDNARISVLIFGVQAVDDDNDNTRISVLIFGVQAVDNDDNARRRKTVLSFSSVRLSRISNQLLISH